MMWLAGVESIFKKWFSEYWELEASDFFNNFHDLIEDPKARLISRPYDSQASLKPANQKSSYFHSLHFLLVLFAEILIV